MSTFKTSITTLDRIMKEHIGYIFICVMGLVYFFLVWHRGEYHFIIAEAQEFIAPHFYNLMSNWEFWEDSPGSNFGGGRDYYLITASYWLSILLSKFLQISIWFIPSYN